MFLWNIKKLRTFFLYRLCQDKENGLAWEGNVLQVLPGNLFAVWHTQLICSLFTLFITLFISCIQTEAICLIYMKRSNLSNIESQK